MKNILSCFDGISGARLALDRLGLSYRDYYSVEIDESAIKISDYNYPNTIRLGDIQSVNSKDLRDIDIIFAGSPCTDFSIAGRRLGMVTKERVEVTSLKQYLKLKRDGFEFEGQSYLFWEFVRLLNETKSKYFLFENVRMNKKWEVLISKVLGVEPVKINSSLLSAQNRERLYWTNIPNVVIPEDHGILLSDIIPGGKAVGYRGKWSDVENKYVRYRSVRKDGKSNCLVTNIGTTSKVVLRNGRERNLTVKESEVLQTVPIGYVDNVPGVSNTNKYRGLGNGWTISVISHILSHLPEYKRGKVKPVLRKK